MDGMASPFAGGNKSMFQSRPSTDYIGFVEPAGHRNVVRAETVTIMRKMVDGSYNLHISGYSYAKTTNDLQAFQSLDEAFAWMELMSTTPLPGNDSLMDDGPDIDRMAAAAAATSSPAPAEPSS